MRPVAAPQTADPSLWVPCANRLALGAGWHRVRPTDGWVLDSLHLRDAAVRPSPVAGVVPRLQVTDARGPRYEIRSSVGDGDFLLVLGEGFDARWRAVVDGRDAGPPEPVDGYTSGWLLDATRPHVVSVVFGPQRSADLGLVASLGGVGLALGLVRRGTPSVPPLAPLAGDPAGRWWRRPRDPWRGRLVWLAVVAGCALVGGWWAALAAVVLAVADLAGRLPRPGRLLIAATCTLALVPVLFLVSAADTWGSVSAALVLDHPWPHRITLIALVLLLVGLARDNQRRATGAARLGADE